MREILFRGKCVAQCTNAICGQWICGNYIIRHIGDVDCHYIVNKYNIAESYIVDANTIGQYIGLKDKNGNRIFEGDIVKTEHGRICRVDYRILNGFVGFDLTPLEYTNKYPSADTLWRKENIEVIGNVYDNPERLEKE